MDTQLKPLIQEMKNVGATQTTVNIFLVYFMTFMFLVGVGLLVIAGYDEIVRNETPAPWIIGTFSSIIGIIGVLFGVSHVTNQVSNVQTKTVQEQQAISKPIVESQAKIGITNAETIQQVLAAMAVLNQTNATNGTSTTSSTPTVQALQENTDATKENTQATEETLHNG